MTTTDRLVIGWLLIAASLWFDGEGSPGQAAPVYGFPLFLCGVGLLGWAAFSIGRRHTRGRQ